MKAAAQPTTRSDVVWHRIVPGAGRGPLSRKFTKNGPRYVALGLLSLIYLLPLFVALNTSLKPPSQTVHTLSLPPSLYFDNYVIAWQRMARPFLNTLMITVPGVVLSVFTGCLVAYPLSQMKLRHGRLIYAFLLLGMFVPYQIVQLPVFFIVRSLGIYNTLIGLWFVHLAYGVAFCTFFMRNFFATVPRSMYEAAQIDGCEATGYFFKILLPASISGLAALAIVQSRGIWNDLLFALTLTHGPAARPVTLELYSMVGTTAISEGPLMASTIISTLPVMIAFLAFQDAFTRGLLGGSSK